MKLTESEYELILEIHTKNEFPREFAYKTLKTQRFYRNEYVWNVRSLYIHCKFRDFYDCYCSVYTFNDKPEDGVKWDRSKAIIDTIFIDLDWKESLTPPLKEAKKVVNWCFEQGFTPRVYFSGAKGFHIYIDLDKPANVDKKAIKLFGIFLCNQLELRTLDMNVLEVARVSRVPLTINTKTGYRCTPIDPRKLLKLTAQDVLHFAKSYYNIPEIDPTDSVRILLEIFNTIPDKKNVVRKRRKIKIDAKASTEYHEIILNAPNKDKCPEYLIPRCLKYIDALLQHRCLSESEYVRRVHAKSEWIAKQNFNRGAIEHIARVHLCLMLISLGLSDEEIHKIFSLCNDYDYDKTQYFIDYNRKWLDTHIS